VKAKGSPYVIAAVEKAVALLKCFLEPPHRYGITELAQKLGTNKNQVFRLVKTLEKNSLLQLDPVTNKYSLGYLAYVLGEVAQPTNALLVAAKPILDELVEREQETLHLLVLDGDQAFCVDKREGNHSIQLTAQIGRHFPSLHAGACPKLLLAYMEDEEQKREIIGRMEFTRFTPNTIDNAEDLWRELAAIRERGYSVSDEDIDLGARGVAVPIFDARGKVVAGLSIGGPVSRMSYQRLDELRHVIAGAAQRISQRLGYTGSNSTDWGGDSG
jgi:DNA-binding IclR family transcriptional regulator